MKKTHLLLTSLALFAGAVNLHAAVIVNVDATGLAPGAYNTLSNSGTAGDFNDIIGGGASTTTHPANNNGAVQVQGLDFSADKFKSANSMVASGISGNQAFTITSWVWNPAIGSEEAMISWGHRGGPDGSNMGFHQGTQGDFGAVGHWSTPDLGYGNLNGTDINNTVNRWAQLAYVYDGAGNQRVFIDGVLSNSDVIGIPALVPHQTFNDLSDTHIYLGSESDAGNENNTPIAYSGTIARWYVEDVALSDAEILSRFDAESPLFFDGIPEPSAGVLALLGAMLMVGRRRRR